ncbi:MAG TPA: methyltransferase domain-containing protein [Gemmatimonadaceae bacterium]
MSPQQGGTEPSGNALIADLERRFVVEKVGITAFGRDVELLAPRNAEELINEDDFERDERLPYWADLWPSAYALAERVAEERCQPGEAPGSGGGRRLLELGCGLGLVTIAAMVAGFDVLATDYYDDALRFTRANAWRALGREPAARHVDWRHFPSDIGTFDRVVAADVLYEPRYAALVANAIAHTLAPAGEALIADPGRLAVNAFLRECEAQGLGVASVESRQYEEGEVRQTILIHQIVHSRNTAEG